MCAQNRPVISSAKLSGVRSKWSYQDNLERTSQPRYSFLEVKIGTVKIHQSQKQFKQIVSQVATREMEITNERRGRVKFPLVT